MIAPAHADRIRIQHPTSGEAVRLRKHGQVVPVVERDPPVPDWPGVPWGSSPRESRPRQIVVCDDPPVERLRLPDVLAHPDDGTAADVVREYMRVAPELPGGVAYTGSLFEGWDGGGDRPEVRDVFTDADVSALALLSVHLKGTGLVELLDRRSDRLSALLQAIPHDIDLHAAPPELVGPGSAAWKLWDELRAIDSIEWVIASKLLSRKRPRLIPVYDNVVRAAVGAPGNFWESLRFELSTEDAALAHRLSRIGQEGGAPNLSILRVFDVLAWMGG